ncbi:SigE family RNA polymerase sigma factor [Streptomyces sp. SAJ15]|uniref:SigE family RNA polymerase sigma factor n=1 Tax=Streptomyces sp. SAJ15 TaxID=2011095 RepID=UPI001184DCDB|nr:SigE family RNA polymerase sigma factor [Streptomyces sp. SAJ15]TVL90985.1 SigE family RNA polymerase sigma factor [Streptomyces sp. SAJ15]
MDAEQEKDFRQFVATRSPALLKLAMLLCGGDRYEAEDLLQNALVKTAGRWHRVEEPEAYVRQVLYRQQVGRWRLRWPRREVTVAAPPERGVVDGAGVVETRIVIRDALSRLTARQRTVLVLRYFEDLPEAEVAALLGCSIGTVRSTTHRSLARLRQLSPELFAAGSGTGRAVRDLSTAEA